MDSAGLPADIMWRIVKYSQNSPLALMLVCRAFARNVKYYYNHRLQITDGQRADTIGRLRHIVLLCNGSYLHYFNPKSLYIWHQHIGDSDLVSLNRLTLLDMSRCSTITDTALAQLTTLTQLTITNCPQITAAGIATLTRVHDLSMSHNMFVAHMPLVQLHVYTPPGKVLAYPITNTTLRDLKLSFCDAYGFDKIPLTHLLLRGSRRSPVSLFTMTTVTNLTIRDDDNVYNDDIINMPLVSLTLEYCPYLTDLGIQSHTALQYLDIDDCNGITGSCLPYLPHLRELKIDVNYASHPCAQNTNYAIARMTALTSLSISFALINDTAVSSLTNLTTLEMRVRSWVTDAGIHSLINLTSLGIANNPYITDRGISHLMSLTRISTYESA